MIVTVSSALGRRLACFASGRWMSFALRSGIVTAFSLALTAWNSTAAQAVCADPGTTPRLDVPAVTCALGQPCNVSIDLSLDDFPNEERVKTVSATLTSDNAITCASCSVQSPAGYGNCIFNAGACALFLGDPFDTVNEFGEGTLANITLTCDELGIHDLDLTGATFGDSDGGVIEGCGRAAAISCGIACDDDLDCSSLDDQCHVGVCDGGTSVCTKTLVGEDPSCAISCPDTLDPFCLDAGRAKFDYNEKRVGREKMNLRWQKIATATTQADYGDPLNGATSVATCIYDDAGILAREFVVDRAGDVCAGKPCWKTKGTRGYEYKDKETSATGISKIDYLSGDAGKGRASTKGKNNAKQGHTSLPTGVVASLNGSTALTIQVLTEDGWCVGATLDEIKEDGPLRFRAQKR